MADLTDEQCDAFRRPPGSFNDMVRAIYRAGRESTATPPADAPRILADTLKQTDANLRAATDGRLGVRECKPADAALADDALCESLIEASDMRWNGDVYVGDGADLMNLVRAALRARAMPDVLNDAIGRLLVAADNLSYEPGTVGGIAELQDAADELGRAMLAASKSGDGGAG